MSGCVGERPGEAEVLVGRPSVGLAGKLLRAAMAEAGLGPAWLTNAVKHFKFRPRGKLRLHQNPTRSEISHCCLWLDRERRFVAPRLTVALGASAAYALTGDAAPLTARRGQVETALDGEAVLMTWHPSRVLRLDGAERQRAHGELLHDLRLAGRMMAATRASPDHSAFRR